MGWTSDEPQSTKKGMETSSKILLAIIACLVLIIILIAVLLMSIEQSTYMISVDGVAVNTVTKDILLKSVDGVTYVNVEEFSKLVKYEYHAGEYKAYTIEEDKCYVQGTNETATFYLNENKVYKLPVNEMASEYNVFSIENTVKKIEEKIYVPLEAISVAFNVQIAEKENTLVIFTLDYLVTWYNSKVIEWGYAGILDQSFENQKSLLCGYFIVKKEGGLYKIIDSNQKEIVSDKYTKIEFNENTQEFLVTNNLSQVGIINLDGTTKIEPIYKSISLLDKENELYLIQKDTKYGIVKSGNTTIIYPEFDSIGITFNSEKQYTILDDLIPVCKNEKWGAFNKKGEIVIPVIYNGFGCNKTTVEVSGIKKTIQPVLKIEKANAVVTEKDEKFVLIDKSGKELITTPVDAIYSINEVEGENKKYFMIYNGTELNIIEKLIEAGLIENDEKKNQTTNNTINSNVTINNKNS